jgi:hypothetical protein
MIYGIMEAKEKIIDFEVRMKNAGYRIQLFNRSKNLYFINDKIVQVRSKSTNSEFIGDRVFYYSININSLNEADYVIYLMTSGSVFVMFPKTYLADYLDNMYQNHTDLATRVFNINWDSLKLWLRDSYPDILGYDYNLEEGELPEFD